MLTTKRCAVATGWDTVHWPTQALEAFQADPGNPEALRRIFDSFGVFEAFLTHPTLLRRIPELGEQFSSLGQLSKVLGATQPSSQLLRDTQARASRVERFQVDNLEALGAIMAGMYQRREEREAIRGPSYFSDTSIPRLLAKAGLRSPESIRGNRKADLPRSQASPVEALRS